MVLEDFLFGNLGFEDLLCEFGKSDEDSILCVYLKMCSLDFTFSCLRNYSKVSASF